MKNFILLLVLFFATSSLQAHIGTTLPPIGPTLEASDNYIYEDGSALIEISSYSNSGRINQN